MEPTRDEQRLLDVQCQIKMLYLVRRDDFNLSDRYRSLVKFEGILLDRIKVPSIRRERELELVG